MVSVALLAHRSSRGKHDSKTNRKKPRTETENRSWIEKVTNPNPSQRTEAAETYQGLAAGATASCGRAEDHQRCRAHRRTTTTTRDGQEPMRLTELLPPYVCGLKAPPPGHSTAARSRTGGARAPARGPTAVPSLIRRAAVPTASAGSQQEKGG